MQYKTLGLLAAVILSSSVAAQEMFSPAALYKTARSIERTDLQGALNLYRKSAEGGYVPAQLLMGGIYLDGLGGVTQDCKQAIYWFQNAAEQGSIEAEGNLGDVYSNPIDKKCNDPAKALRHFNIAAKKKHGPSQNALARLYVVGKGAKRSVEEAYAWASVAMTNGQYQDGLKLRDMTQRQMSESQLLKAKKLASEYRRAYGGTVN